MNEKFLQFVWRFQYFNKNDLQSTDGDPLEIIHPGAINHHQGPDFLNAHVRIGQTHWVGQVELHIQTMDWNRHGHQHDPLYSNVILHVVWDHNGLEPSEIPVLALSGRVPQILEQTYLSWMHNLCRIPCESSFRNKKAEITNAWVKKLIIERLQRRNEEISSKLKRAGNCWDTVFWWYLARNFGFRVNADAFEEMAMSLPLPILIRSSGSIHQTEALLLGQCGLLHVKTSDPYVLMLQREYNFLKHKHHLRPGRIQVKFLRMRPSNFPTIRLAQLAMLIHQNNRLFSSLMELVNVDDAFVKLRVTANDFWHYHYKLGKPSAFLEKTVGKDMITNIIVNTIVPFLYSFGMHRGDDKMITKAISWLEKADPETNATIEVFLSHKAQKISAMDTQAMLELEKEYCSRKRCLECDIGLKLMYPEGTDANLSGRISPNDS